MEEAGDRAVADQVWRELFAGALESVGNGKGAGELTFSAPETARVWRQGDEPRISPCTHLHGWFSSRGSRRYREWVLSSSSSLRFGADPISTLRNEFSGARTVHQMLSNRRSRTRRPLGIGLHLGIFDQHRSQRCPYRRQRRIRFERSCCEFGFGVPMRASRKKANEDVLVQGSQRLR